MDNREEIKRGPHGKGKIAVGVIILAVGCILLANELGADMPDWLLTWPMILIGVGIANGIKHQFRNSTWLIFVLIGGVFLLEKINPELSVAHYTWPVVLIGVGIWFIFGKGFRHNESCFRGRRRRRWGEEYDYYQTSANAGQTEVPKNDEPVDEDKRYHTTGDEFLDSVSVFGSTKKNILSKNFKGGDIVTIMGGAEINLTHSDIGGMVVLDVTQVFGGTKIIVPPTWDVTSEMAAIFGGIEDKRSLIQVLPDRSKVLLIKGTSIFGGIEIKNFNQKIFLQ